TGRLRCSHFETTLERAVDPPLKSEGLFCYRAKPSSFPCSIDGPKNAKELTTYRCVGFKGNLCELPLKARHGSTHGKIDEVGFQLLIVVLFDAHMRMSTSEAYEITSKPDRPAANVADARGFVLEEPMLAVCRKNQKNPVEANVLKVCGPRLFTPRPCPLRNVDPKAGDELLVNGTRIFALGNAPSHVEEVSVANERHGHLLNEPSN